MRPVLFYIGPLAVWSYGTFIALGMITLFRVLHTCTREHAASELIALADKPGGHGDRIAIVILCET